VALQVPDDALEVRVTVPIRESIESACRRMAVFSRLLDRSSRGFEEWSTTDPRGSTADRVLSGSAGGA